MRIHAVIHGGPYGWAEVVEGLVQRNVRAIREGKARGLAVASIGYAHDHLWRDIPAALESGIASAGTMAAWHAAEKIVQGAPAAVGFVEGNPVVLVGRASESQVAIDPSRRFGRRDTIGLIGALPGEDRKGVIREKMDLVIDDAYALPVREVNSAIARHNARLIREGWKIPPLYASGIRYELEGSPEIWKDAPAMLVDGFDDCEGLAAYRAGELIAREGLDADVWTRLIQRPDDFGGSGGGRTFHAITRVRTPDGRILFDDPSARMPAAPMPVPSWYFKWAAERRAKGLTLDWPPTRADGQDRVDGERPRARAVAAYARTDYPI